VNSAEFKKYATLFCLAYQQLCPKSVSEKTATKNSSEDRQVQLLHMFKPGAAGGENYDISILDDLISRKAKYHSIYTAITANAVGMICESKQKTTCHQNVA